MLRFAGKKGKSGLWVARIVCKRDMARRPPELSPARISWDGGTALCGEPGSG